MIQDKTAFLPLSAPPKKKDPKDAENRPAVIPSIEKSTEFFRPGISGKEIPFFFGGERARKGWD